MSRRLEAKKGGIGEPSSKYGYDRTGEQFDADIQANNARMETLWNDFVEFMQSHEVDPRKFCFLFVRYHEEFLKG